MLDALQTVLLLLVLGWLIVRQKDGGLGGLASRLSARPQVIVDSCGLIDGRIIELVQSGFLPGRLIIPQFILNELQLLADGSDSHKRERARFGLDIARQLQDTAAARVQIERTVFPQASAIDDKLVLLAKKIRGHLYTTDYNLSKVAAVEGITVLNVNELAQSLRPITLPGETLEIKIVQKGSNRDQGVGYLDDGTMIVVDGAARHIGKNMPVTVTRMHQTVAGKMVFGRVRTQDKPTRQRHEHHSHNPSEAPPHDRPATAQKPPRSLARTIQSKLHSRLHKPLQLRRKRRPIV